MNHELREDLNFNSGRLLDQFHRGFDGGGVALVRLVEVLAKSDLLRRRLRPVPFDVFCDELLGVRLVSGKALHQRVGSRNEGSVVLCVKGDDAIAITLVARF